MTGSVSFTLPFPDKLLWPNGRTRRYMAKHRVLKSHRGWAKIAAQAAGVKNLPRGHSYSIAITVHPKTKHPIDRDNAVSSAKAYLDGIADAMGVDDRHFDTPTIAFAEPVKGGLMTIALSVTPHPRAAQ